MSADNWLETQEWANRIIQGSASWEEAKQFLTDPESYNRLVKLVDETVYSIHLASAIEELEQMESTMHNGGPAMTKDEIEMLEDLRSIYTERGYSVTVF